MSSAESTTPLQQIRFHDDILYAVVDERTGKEYVLPKPMVEIFGLIWSPQLRKLKRHQIFSRGMTMMVIDSAQGLQETVLLERRLVQAWLFTIDANRVLPEYREKLLRYQEECAAVLDAYFTQGAAIHPSAPDLPVLHDPAYQMLIKAIVDLDATRHELAQIEQRQREQDRQLIATQAQSIEALMAANQAQAKADLALEDAHRMTIEEWVMHNGLLHQLPVSSWKRISDWLRPFCLAHGLKIEKAVVPGKLWPEENTYPLVAFGAWWRSELKRPTQVHLVPTPPAETTPQ
jgi:hypothetical protein